MLVAEQAGEVDADPLRQGMNGWPAKALFRYGGLGQCRNCPRPQ
jgi:hypothetical protein